MNKPKRKIDASKVIELREKGLSVPDIAKQQGVAASTIYRFLESKTEDFQKLERFTGNKVRVLQQLQSESAELRLRVMASLSQEDVEQWTVTEKKELLRALCTSQAIDFDKEKLLTGKDTDLSRLSDQQLAERFIVTLKAIGLSEDALGVVREAMPGKAQ